MLSSVHSHSYAIHFNETAYEKLNTFLQSASYSKIFILVDENTHRFCLSAFTEKIQKNNALTVIRIASGEHHKTIATCLDVWRVLAKKGGDRKSLLIALGGGVITDLGGFVASTYMRGIDFINVPTSLLAMVDASVGGKTGVDLGALKNLIGVINFPKMVLIDTAFLSTLPEAHMKSGMAEMFKHGLIRDEAYWHTLSELSELELNKRFNESIQQSVMIKNTIVMQDPKEQGLRKVLNYGHTLGHAIESCFLNTEIPLLHGEAIAVGMVLASYISHRLTGFPLLKLAHIKKVLRMYFKPVYFTETHHKKILELLRYDKKNTYGSINFVLLEDIGRPVLDKAVSEALIMEAFEYYEK